MNGARGIVPLVIGPKVIGLSAPVRPVIVRSVNVVRGIVPLVIGLKVIGLSVPVPPVIVRFVNAVRGTAPLVIVLVDRVHHEMGPSAIRVNSVAGLKKGGADGVVVLSQRLNRVRGIALPKLWRGPDFARVAMRRRGFLKVAWSSMAKHLPRPRGTLCRVIASRLMASHCRSVSARVFFFTTSRAAL